MPLDLSDVPPLVLEGLRVLDTVRRGLRKKSEGGKKLTTEEKREIGEALVKLGERFLLEAAD